MKMGNDQGRPFRNRHAWNVALDGFVRAPQRLDALHF